MDFGFDARTAELHERLTDFMDEHVYPAEPVFDEQVAAARTTRGPARRSSRSSRREARDRGLWNLFLPDDRFGAGLTNLQYAPLAEMTGRSPHLAPEALNCAAPDTGNMELLAEFGIAEQQDALAEAAAGGRDPLGVLHDRARRRLLRRDQHRHPHRARRRRVRRSTAASGGPPARWTRTARCSSSWARPTRTPSGTGSRA